MSAVVKSFPEDSTFGRPDGLLPGEERDDGTTASAIVLDIAAPAMTETVDGVAIQTMPDGTIVLDMEPGEGQGDSDGMPPEAFEHDANLAEFLSETDLATIASQVEDWVAADLDARVQWFDRLADGLELVGAVPTKGFDGLLKMAEKVSHPLITEAVTQFQARAIAEILPPGGPAKASVLGKSSPELEDQAERVAGYINYQLMVEDPTFFPETDQLLAILARSGSQFKKVYRDPLKERNISRWVRGQYLVVPYGATSLEDAPRFTHLIQTQQNDMRKMQASGFYRECHLGMPTGDQGPKNREQETQDQAQGQTDTRIIGLDDADYLVMECYADFDLPGFEDVDEKGEATGIALPYIVSVDRDSLKVLSIRRNWDPDEAMKTGRKDKEVWFVHYPYLPGDGFYSDGLIHKIGGLGQAANGLMKIILIGSAFASFQGGFKSADARMPSDVQLEWGKYQDVDMTAAELAKAFFTPDFKQPNEAMFRILGVIEEAGRRFSSTADSMVGDASNTGPVGTTVALIEQGSKVFSGIHKRIHFGQGQELKLIAKLNGRYVPEEGYPYAVQGEDRQIYRADFDSRIDVLPVSDPNIYSSTQRISIAQSVMQRADINPGMYDRRKVELHFLKALKVPQADEFLLDPDNIKRADPVTENALLMVGRPVRAFQDQLHQAHIAVHMDTLHRMEAEQNPLLKQAGGQFMAHIAEHLAYQTRQDYMMAMGVQMPPIDLYGRDEDEQPQIPPQIENQIAQRAAAAIARLPAPQVAQPDQAAQQAAQQAKAMEAKAQALQKEQEKLRSMAESADKKTAQAKAAANELALKTEIAQLKQQMAGMHQQDATRKVIEEAVARVEKALTAHGDSAT